MGQLNQPTNVLDRVVKLERGLQEIRKLAGLTSAIISRGGLTLLNDSFIKMVDDLGTEILYIGPNVDGKQVYVLRRENGSIVLQSSYFAGQPFFAMRDQNNVILFSDDAAGSGGMARPWLPITLYQAFHSIGAPDTLGLAALTASVIASEQILWVGRASVLHKRVELNGTWGRASGTVSVTTYRLKFNGVTVGTWTEGVGATGVRGPYDISDYLGMDNVEVTLTASATGGDIVYIQPSGVYMRQV